MAPRKKKGKVSAATKSLRKSAKARKAKAAYDKKFNARPEQKKKRAESNKKRKDAKKNGKDVRGKDYDHKSGRFISSSANRGKKGEGNRKKGVKRGSYKKRR